MESELMETLDINEDCKKNLNFSDALEKSDSCFNCEFCRTFKEQIIGGLKGTAFAGYYCEKGY